MTLLLILFIWILSLYFLKSLVKVCQFLFIFSKNQLLVSLICCIVFLSFYVIYFNSDLNYFLPSTYYGLSLLSFQFFQALISVFLNSNHLRERKAQFLFCISLMTTDVKHHSRYLSVIYIWINAYSDICLFLVGLFAFLFLCCKCSLYILDSRTLHKKFANIFSNSGGYI